MHFFVIPFLTIVFIAWIVYHSFIRKDMSKHRHELYGGLIFIGIWMVLYVCLINAAG